jgi:succinate dehydrogenase hydrophobic membrane anchor protein
MASLPLPLRLWRLQRTTALIALPLVAAHVVVQFFIFGMDGTTSAVVAQRLRGGLLLALDLALLAAVATHGYLGLRAVIADYVREGAAAARAVCVVALLLAATLLYGVAALVALL